MIIFIRDYLIEGLFPYYLIEIIAYTIFRVIFIKCRKKVFVLKKEFLLFVFASYCVAIISATIMPQWCKSTIDSVTHIEFVRNEPKFNFIPFKSISSFLELTGENSKINLIVNFFLLFPFGLLFPIICPTYKKKTLIYGILISISIEVLQIIPGRSTDIDDVILNIGGCSIGYGIAHLIIDTYYNNEKRKKKR